MRVPDGGITFEGAPRVLLGPAALLTLGVSFAQRIQILTPSPPWDAVAIDLVKEDPDRVVLALQRGHVVIALPFDVVKLQHQPTQFLDLWPVVLEGLELRYQQALRDFEGEGQVDVSPTHR